MENSNITENGGEPLDETLRPSSNKGGGLVAYLVATIGVALAAGIATVLQLLPHANLSLVFLTAVVIVAARYGMGPSLYASALSFLVYNFAFTSPFYTLKVDSEGDVATLVFFLAMAALSGNLAVRARAAIDKREDALRRISLLDAFLRQMAAAATVKEIATALVEHLAKICESSVAIFTPSERGDLELCARRGEFGITANDPAVAATWTGEELRQTTSWGCAIKLATPDRALGVVALHYTAPLHQDKLQLVSAICEQAAVGMDRAKLVEDVEKAKLAAETEQLRSALLSSVSHDLRTPLASIIGSTTSLIEYGESFSIADRRTLQRTVLDEAQRLDRYIQNLLDMTRLGHGRTTLKRGWQDLGDMVAAALQRMGVSLEDKTVNVQIEPEASLLWVHGALIEQVLVNLLDNALRFSPAAGHIDIHARRDGQYILIDVVDQGPGIPEADRERVFDMFYRVEGTDRRDTGTGLGLAICRGLVGAHGGSIKALPGPTGTGTTIRVTLPFHQLPPADESE